MNKSLYINNTKFYYTIKFYKRYVDDTLVLIKPSDISAVLAKFNSFDPNLTFTVDTFSEGIVHFLDIKVSVDGTDIYRKDTHTGQYSHFSSFEPFYRKTAWVKSLYRRAFKICSTKSLLNNQIEIIKSFLSWNGYPKSIQNFLMKKIKLKTKYSDSSTSVTVNEDTVDNLPKIWIRIPYLGSRGDFLLKSCLNKVQRFLSKPVKFITIYDTKKLSYFVSNKDNFRTYVYLTSGHMSNAFSLRCIYLSCKVLYFILSDDDFEIKSKIYSFNLRLVLKHILHSQDVFFRNLLFTLLF